MSNYETLKSCRICAGQVKSVYNLGLLYPSAFLSEFDNVPAKAPLDLVQCQSCGLIQLGHTVNLDELYRQYFYRSSVNPVMVAALQDVVDSILDRANLKLGDVVVDTGSNDGTLLSMYPPYLAKVGFEPSLNLTKVFEPDYAIADYFSAQTYPLELPKAKVVTSLAMFYDLPAPVQFVEDVKLVLAPDGLWVVQLSDLRSMLEGNIVENVCLAPEVEIYTRSGLKPIIDVEVGDEVLTHKGRWRKVLEVQENNFDGSLIKLRAYGFGSDLVATPNHPVFVKKDGTWKCTPASEVRIGDIVGKPITIDVEDVDTISIEPRSRVKQDTVLEVPVNDDLLTVMGYYLAEGHVNKSNHATVFDFGSHERETLVADCVARLQNLGFKANTYDGETSTIHVTSYGAIGRFLIEACGRGAHKKRLADWVMRLPAEKQRVLFNAYAKGDGYVYRGTYQRLITASKELAHQLCTLANRIGYKATLNTYQPRLSEIDGRVINGRGGWDIQVNTDPKKKIKNWIEDGYQCGRIRAIEDVPYSGSVYNMTVEEDHTYVTTAMMTHNCHEHLEYYRTSDIVNLMSRAGLEVFRIERNDVNGGSLRYYIRWESGLPLEVSVAQTLYDEMEYFESPEGSIEAFKARITFARDTLLAWLKRCKTEGLSVYGLGASTKANTLLQYFEIDNTLIQSIGDLNPDKFGKLMLGSDIPITSEADVMASNPDALIIFVWHFLPFFLERLQSYMRSGGVVVVPLPVPTCYFIEPDEPSVTYHAPLHIVLDEAYHGD